MSALPGGAAAPAAAPTCNGACGDLNPDNWTKCDLFRTGGLCACGAPVDADPFTAREPDSESIAVAARWELSECVACWERHNLALGLEPETPRRDLAENL